MGFLIAGIIGAVVGGVVGVVNTIIDSNNAMADAQNQEDALAAQHKDRKDLLDLEFANAKAEAERNADKADAQADLQDQGLDISERAISDDYNNQIDAIQVQQESNLFSWNTALMQAGASEGASLANAAASGVRAGSTMSQAIEMESAVNSAALQQQQDTARQSINNNLDTLFNSLNQNQFSIMSGRIDADNTRDDAAYLRNSYKEGGNNYKIYQQNLKSLNTNYELSYNELERQKQKISSSMGWNTVAALLSGGASGFATGSKIGSSIQNWSGYNGGYTTTIADNE